MVPVALASLVLLAAAMRGRWRLCRLIALGRSRRDRRRARRRPVRRPRPGRRRGRLRGRRGDAARAVSTRSSSRACCSPASALLLGRELKHAARRGHPGAGPRRSERREPTRSCCARRPEPTGRGGQGVSRLPRAEVILPMAIVLRRGPPARVRVHGHLRAHPPGGEPQDQQTAADRHSYAMLVLAVFAIAAHRRRDRDRPAGRPSRPPRSASRALLLFLLLDLPEAGNIGHHRGDDGPSVLRPPRPSRRSASGSRRSAPASAWRRSPSRPCSEQLRARLLLAGAASARGRARSGCDAGARTEAARRRAEARRRRPTRPREAGAGRAHERKPTSGRPLRQEAGRRAAAVESNGRRQAARAATGAASTA